MSELAIQTAVAIQRQFPTGTRTACTHPRERDERLCVQPDSSPRVPPFDRLAPTIFHSAWWLNAVTGGDYAEVTVSQSGRKVGSFPYRIWHGPAGHRLCGMPPLTHFLGPAVDEGTGSACNRVLRRAQITRDLLQQVRPCSGFWQKLHRGTQEALVYQEQGLKAAVQFTFEIAPASHEALWCGLRDKTRNVIRRAEEQHRVVELADPAAFAAMYIDNLAAQGQRSHYSTALLTRACQAAITHGQGRMLAAETKAGTMTAAICYIWDAQAAYYLLSTRRPDAGNGAISLLLWHAICDVASRGLIFDFDGILSPGSALFFTGFGGTVVPRYVVSRYTLGHRIVNRLSHPLDRKPAETFS
jgi:Acetyltransferase (GNAT) domain